MATQTISYDNKVSIETNPLPEVNKCTANNLNEIKSVVNNNAGELDTTNNNVTDLQTNKLNASAVKNARSTSTSEVYCANYINTYYQTVTEIYNASSSTGAQSLVEFSDISGYDYIEILYGQANGNFLTSIKIIPSISIGYTISLTINAPAADSGVIYLNSGRFDLTATSLSLYRVTQKQFSANNSTSTTSSTTPTNIKIYKILGYKQN